jgi:hypothetical protein
MKAHWEAMTGCLIAAAGLVWASKIVTENFTIVPAIQLPPGGPIELCALGIVIWLHAKFRMHTSINR